MMSVRAYGLAVLLVLGCVLALPAPCRAQQVQVTPNPAPLNGPVTIHGVGFFPNAPVLVFWDNPTPSSLVSNMYLPAANTADASGSFTLTLQVPTLNVYPATAGAHTLTLAWSDGTGGLASMNVPVNFAPRAGWAAPVPLPTGAQAGLSGGTIAFLRYSADLNATSLVATDGATERLLGAAPTPALLFGLPDWSPDGSKLAFNAQLDAPPYQDLYTLDVNTGQVTQVTALGGSPPALTGGGTGALVGAILPYLGETGQTLIVTPPDAAGCIDMFKFVKDPDTGDVFKVLNSGFFPKGGFVTLVGTGFTMAVPLPPGSQDGDPFPFAIAGIPEGDYSLHMWHNSIVCQDDTETDTGSGTGTRKIQRKAAGVPNLTVPVHVTAGQVTIVPTVRMVASYETVQSPSWISNDSLVYIRSGGVYSVAKGPAVSDVWSQRLGQAPVQVTTTLQQGKVFESGASPTDGLFAVNSEAGTGLVYADPTNLLGTVQLLTSWLPISAVASVATADRSPAWDPTGGYVAFVRQFPQVSQVVGNVCYKVVATGEERQVTNFSGQNLQDGEGAVGRPAWSPDRSQIAFTYTKDNVKTANIRVVNVATGTFFDVTTDGRSALPSWTAARPLAGLPQNVDLQNHLPGITAGEGAVRGDLNGDSQVTVQDAVLGLRGIVGLDPVTPAMLQAGDLNKDGALAIDDIVGVLQIIVGLG